VPPTDPVRPCYRPADRVHGQCHCGHISSIVWTAGKVLVEIQGVIRLSLPITEEQVSALKAGDEVLISGIVFTARDAVHKYLYEDGPLPHGVSLRNGIIYHCGPVVLKDAHGNWKVVAAGPTTSTRQESYQAKIIRVHGLRGIIGKGGMGEATLAACKQYGCVYLHAVGGAAQVLAECVKRVRNVHFIERFGPTEAMWELEVEDFPALVTIDAHGRSLHAEILAASRAALAGLISNA